jgi:hypothetical protein
MKKFRKDGYDYVTDSKEAAEDFIKLLKKLARGKAPPKAPGYFTHNSIVDGRDGNKWQTIHVIYDDRFASEWIQI